MGPQRLLNPVPRGGLWIHSSKWFSNLCINTSMDSKLAFEGSHLLLDDPSPWEFLSYVYAVCWCWRCYEWSHHYMSGTLSAAWDSLPHRTFNTTSRDTPMFTRDTLAKALTMTKWVSGPVGLAPRPCSDHCIAGPAGDRSQVGLVTDCLIRAAKT